MLRHAAIEREPSAVQRRQTDIHRRQDRTEIDAGGDHQGVDRKIDARGPVNLRALALRHEGRLLVGQPAGGVQKHLAKEDARVLEREDVEEKRHNVRGTRRDDLGIAPDDDRIRMVAGMAPTPDLRFAHDHEAGDLIDHIVHPLRLERGAMAALVPAAVSRGAVENAINDKEGNRRPASPKIIAEASRHDERREPDERISDRWTVVAAHELFEFGPSDWWSIPSRRGESTGDSSVGLGTDEAVIASDRRG